MNSVQKLDFEHAGMDFIVLYKTSLFLRQKVQNTVLTECYKPDDLSTIIFELDKIVALYQKILVENQINVEKLNSNDLYILYKYRYDIWINRISYEYVILLYLIRRLFKKLINQREEIHIYIAMRLIKSYNSLLQHKNKNIFEECNEDLQSFEKITLRYILKIMADERSKTCCFNLVGNLYNRYIEMYIANSIEDTDCAVTDSQLNTEFTNESCNTNIVVYKTLTQYVSPAVSSHVLPPSAENSDQTESPATSKRLHLLMMHERKHLLLLLFVLARKPGQLINKQNIKTSKKTGCSKIRKEAMEAIVEMYEQFLWAKVSVLNEHVLLWWAPYSIGTHHLPAERFKLWLQQISLKMCIPKSMLPVIYNLTDSIRSYITITSWDELFRQAFISADYDHAQHTVCNIGLGTRTGHLFSDVFYNLIYLNNEYGGGKWKLMLNSGDEKEDSKQNIPLIEHIQLLHRLDHSIHIVRLWAASRAKYLANAWNMVQFFRVTYTDVNAALYALSQLKLPKNEAILENEVIDVSFIVCIKMRKKLVSEINTNIEKFRKLINDSLSILSSVCRVISLSQLCIYFPNKRYWSQMIDSTDQAPSDYVEDYLNDVLQPVLIASQNLPLSAQKSVSKLILTIVCESWLHHIYHRRIKFSNWGAVQLLTDFGAVSAWIKRNSCIGEELQHFLISDEILQRCLGVAHLLLRQPGELLTMKHTPLISSENDEQLKSDLNERMPPEMYVTNQQKWLLMKQNQRKPAHLTCC